MKTTKSLIILLSIVGLSGCFEPKIDASSDNSLQGSLEQIYQILPIEKGNQLKLDINVLNEYFQRRIYKGEPVEEAQKQYMAILNRKTPSEVSEEVDRLRPYVGQDRR